VVARYADATVEVESVYGHPTLFNSEVSYQHSRALLEAAGQQTARASLTMGGEDFAHYLEMRGGVPGCIWMLGAQQDGTGDHHTPPFNPDEAVFWRGVLFWLVLTCCD
jgi:metal-dependent amidase/aminoacylase/carboxypeptidase family protein